MTVVLAGQLADFADARALAARQELVTIGIMERVSACTSIGFLKEEPFTKLRPLTVVRAVRFSQ